MHTVEVWGLSFELLRLSKLVSDFDVAVVIQVNVAGFKVA